MQKKKPSSCKACNYIRSHKNNGINADLMSGVAYRVITQRTGLSYETLKRHRDEGHMMDRFLPRIGCTKHAKAELDLMKSAKEIYDLSLEAAKIAMGKVESKNENVKPDLRAFGSCISGATKVVEVLARVDPEKKDGSGPKESAFWLAYGERAKVVFDGKQT